MKDCQPKSKTPNRKEPCMKWKLELGALCDPIAKQLPGLLPKAAADRLDRDSDAINRLYVCGYITESATERLRKKLITRVQKAINDHHKSK